MGRDGYAESGGEILKEGEGGCKQESRTFFSWQTKSAKGSLDLCGLGMCKCVCWFCGSSMKNENNEKWLI